MASQQEATGTHIPAKNDPNEVHGGLGMGGMVHGRLVDGGAETVWVRSVEYTQRHDQKAQDQKITSGWEVVSSKGVR
jgi:hypothetical protein